MAFYVMVCLPVLFNWKYSMYVCGSAENCFMYFCCSDSSILCTFVVQVEMFRAEKAKLDMEVAKWDDSGNDIIVMAKQMCMIMMEMTDFTRSVGHCVCLARI